MHTKGRTPGQQMWTRPLEAPSLHPRSLEVLCAAAELSPLSGLGGSGDT